MMFLKLSYGCAPTISRPLMMNDGVPVTPTDAPSAWSAFTLSAVFLLSKQSLNLAASILSLAAYWSAFSFTFSAVTSFWLSKKPLYTLQKASGFCCLAHSAAIAAGVAHGWNGSG